MLGWLKKKGQDARVYACIKELKWELESADQIKIAKIFATASMVRNEFFSGKGTPFNDVVDRPLDYSREVDLPENMYYLIFLTFFRGDVDLGPLFLLATP